jgi:hypothetical protein
MKWSGDKILGIEVSACSLSTIGVNIELFPIKMTGEKKIDEPTVHKLLLFSKGEQFG